MSLYNLVSFAGIFILVGFAWLVSSDRKNVNYRVIIWGISLQLLFGAFIFLLPAGAKVFLFINDIVVKVLGSASAGAEFLFGRLALPPGARNAAGEGSLGFSWLSRPFPLKSFSRRSCQSSITRALCPG